MSNISRRGFLAAGAAAAAPLILPSRVLGLGGEPGPNEQIVLGCIGVGGMGNMVMRSMNRWHPVAAVCEADTQRAEAAAGLLDNDVDRYGDYRRLLDRQDIDAVIIATPDHWHAVQTLHAVEAGKDVYVEKPLGNTIEEGKAVLDAVHRHGAIVQVGNQGRSNELFHRFYSFIRNGEIGSIKRVDNWHYPNPEGPSPPDQAPPDHLDWDMWLGPARWRPYNPAYCHSTFRWFMFSGGGNIRDRGAHMLSLVLWALDRDNDGPVKVTATGTPATRGNYDNPIEMDVTWEFTDPEVTVTWRQPGDPPEDGLDIGYGIAYHGEGGSAYHWGTADEPGCGVSDNVADYEPSADGVQLYRSAHHHQNWLECIKTREQPIMPVGPAHRAASMCILGNLAYLLGRPLEYDPRAERFINDGQANLLLRSPGRGPWHV